MNLRVFYLTRRGLSDGYNSLGNIFSAFRQCVSKWKADKAFFLMTMQQDNRKKRAAMPP